MRLWPNIIGLLLLALVSEMTRSGRIRRETGGTDGEPC